MTKNTGMGFAFSVLSTVTILSTATVNSAFAEIPTSNGDVDTFLVNACAGAIAGSNLQTRCNETQDLDAVGKLSGDSEISMTPSQSLSYNANAVAETSQRIKAMMAKMKNKATEEKFFKNKKKDNREAMEVFRMSGSSLLVQVNSGNYEQEANNFEKAYTKESSGIQLGLDYRISDSWLAGVMLGYDQFDQTFDQQTTSGGLFSSRANEGDSDAKNYSISLFTSKNYGENIYVEGMLSYITSDYSFNRNIVYQRSSRKLLDGTPYGGTAYDVSADTDGKQFAANLGAGFTNRLKQFDYTVYGRLDYKNTEIDEYAEQGASGLELTINNSDYSETVGTLGLKFSSNINVSYGVLIPQLYIEWQHAFDRDISVNTSYFSQDTNKTSYSIAGNEVDKSSGSVGFSVLTGLPNGWMLYAGANKTLGRDYVSEYNVNAGLRVEF